MSRIGRVGGVHGRSSENISPQKKKYLQGINSQIVLVNGGGGGGGARGASQQVKV